MSEEINKKVIDIFSKHSKSLPSSEPVKFYAGFNYVKLAKDNNGAPYISIVLRAESSDSLYAQMTDLLEEIGK